MPDNVLEMDEVNKNECMSTLVSLLKHMKIWRVYDYPNQVFYCISICLRLPKSGILMYFNLFTITQIRYSIVFQFVYDYPNQVF